MKTKTSLHFFFSLCLLSLCSLIWGGNLLSAQTTVTSTFTDKDWGVGKGEPEWTKTGANATGFEKANLARGVQTTLKNIQSSGLSLTNTTIQSLGSIKSVTMVLSSNGTGGSIQSVKVGETQLKNNGETTMTVPKANNKEYSFTTTDAVAGDIVITFGSTATKNSLYVKSIKVEYEKAGSGEGGGSTSVTQEFDFTNPTMDAYSDQATLTNALTGEAKGAVTYTSSAETVATVDANGEVTIQGVGTATITATAAAATDGETKYKETSKRYTLHVWPTSIAELKSIITNSEAAFKAKLTDAYITYVNGNNAYLQDATGAILIYKSSHGLTAGNCYTGEISGKTMKYNNNLNEITAFDFSQATLTNKPDIAPQEVSMAVLSTNFAQYESMYIKVTEVTASAAVKIKDDKCTLTQNSTEYDSPVLRAAASLTKGITAGTTYPAIVVFPGYYNTTKQLNLWSDDLVTLPDGTLQAPDVAFGAAAYEVAINEAIELLFTTDSDGDVTYTASPSEDIALTKTDNGVSVTATATGTFNITANVAETANFAAGSTSTTLTVTPPASNLQNVVLYKKVTSTDALIDGAQYLVVCESKNKALVAGTSNIHSSTPADVTTADNKIASETVASGDVAVFTLGTVVSGTSTHYTLKIGDKFVTGADGTGLSLGSNNTTKAAHWTVAFNNENVEITNVSYSTRGIMYSTSDAFKHYAISQRGDANYPAIQLYQKVGELKAHGVMGGYASYAADFAYIMPEGLMGKIVYLDGNKLTTDNIYAGGTEVPALTPLLIRTYEAISGTDEKTYYPVVLDKEVAADEEVAAKNALEYRRAIVDGKYMTSSLNFGEGCRYYKLSVDSEGQNPGFYYGAADGAPFQMKNGSSAYLTVSASLASPALLFDDNEITGIENLTPAQGEANNGAVYNLQGVRMNGKNLQKGLYIINGKKVVIK